MNDRPTSTVTPPPAAPGWSVVPAKATTLIRCARHREVDGRFRCMRCRQAWCALCVKAGNERGVEWRLCSCGGRCDAIVPESAPPTVAEFNAELLDAFLYPLRGEARLQLVLGGIFYAIFGKLFGASFLGALANATSGGAGSGLGVYALIIAAAALAAIAGYVFAYVELVVAHTARGRDDPPGFPEFLSTWESLFQPVGRLAALLAVSFAPGALALLLPGAFALLGVVLLIAGLAWFPMALLAVSVLDTEQGFDPRRILASIRAVPGPYTLAAALFLATFGLLLGGNFLLVDVPWIGGLLRGTLLFALATVAGRVLGLTYRRFSRELGWLDETPPAK